MHIGQTQADLHNTARSLIVDDSRAERRVMAKRLRRWGYQVDEAESGKQAMSMCQAHEYDLVLSDWVMPEMDGIAFCEAFRAMERKRYGYFILLTSKSDKEDIAQGLDCGADDFLSKPVDPNELRARLRAGQRILDMEDRLKVEIARTNDALMTIQDINAGIQKDLKAAERLQRSLIPASTVETDAYCVSNLFKPSAHIGGDLVGMFELAPNRVAIYSIDVSGHGVSSALLTMRLHGLLSPHSKDDNLAFDIQSNGKTRIRHGDEIASLLNERMLDGEDTDLYFTMAYADIDLNSGQVEIVQAGHAHPILIRNGEAPMHIGDGGLPIGLVPKAHFDLIKLRMDQQDKLLLFSDGLSECQNATGALLEEDGLVELLCLTKGFHGEELLNDLLWHITEYTQGSGFEDDVSAILFEYF